MNRRLLCIASAVILIVSCDRNDPPPAAVDLRGDLDHFFTSTARVDAMQIHVAREAATPGDEITLQGMVMGRTRPFVEDRAAFVLGDRTLLTPCNEKEDDDCATPWDACCDSSENKRKGTATIQLVGEDGRVIPFSLRGVNGLVELSKLTVTGTVAEGSGEESLIVNAREIHVHH